MSVQQKLESRSALSAQILETWPRMISPSYRSQLVSGQPLMFWEANTFIDFGPMESRFSIRADRYDKACSPIASICLRTTVESSQAAIVVEVSKLQAYPYYRTYLCR
jgi:hypothetical protein